MSVMCGNLGEPITYVFKCLRVAKVRAFFMSGESVNTFLHVYAIWKWEFPNTGALVMVY